MNLFDYRLCETHVAKLCSDYDIKRLVRPGRGRARVNARVVRHPAVRSEMAYFVALHEIGHVVLGLPEGLSRLDREAWCWRFALEKALVQPAYPTRQRIAACLLRYFFQAAHEGWPLPDPESDFWRLMQWWDPPAYAAA